MIDQVHRLARRGKSNKNALKFYDELLSSNSDDYDIDSHDDIETAGGDDEEAEKDNDDSSYKPES